MNRSVAVNGSPFLPPPPRRGVLSLAEEEEDEEEREGLPGRSNNCHRRPTTKQNNRRTGARSSEPRVPVARGMGGGSSRSGSKWAVAAAGGSGDVWPGQGWGRQVVRSGVEAIAGLPLVGDERDEVAVKAAAAAEEVWLSSSRERQRQRLRRQRQRQRQPTPAVSRPSTGPANSQNEPGGQESPPGGKVVAPTHDHGGGGGGESVERVVAPAAPRSTADDVAVESTVVDEKVGDKTTKLSRYGALSPPVSPASVLAASEAMLTAPPQEETPLSLRLQRSHPRLHQQWGGFGPGHVPKYFRGKFGVAGERKRLIHRHNGDDGVGVI